MSPYRYILLCLAALMLAGCSPKEAVDEIFEDSSDILLRIDGATVITYHPLTWQMGYTSSRNEWQVMRDDGASYYSLTCNEKPSDAGQNVKASLSWNTGDGTLHRENDLSWRVVKTDSQGTVWLWCSDKKIGVSVRTLR